MKGVEAVIAVILILMIVVALAALAYTWFTGIFSTLTQTAGTSITTTTGSMAKQFRLEAASCNANPCTVANTVSYTIRNTGRGTFEGSNTAAYIDGVPQPAITCAAGALAEGAVLTCSGNPAQAVTCRTSLLKTTIETGLSDSRVVDC